MRLAALALLAGCSRPAPEVTPAERACELLEAGALLEARDAFLDLVASGHPGADYGLGVVLRKLDDLPGSLACLSAYDPSEDLALTLAAMGECEREVLVRTRLLDADPLSLFNLAAALECAGYPVTGLYLEVLARTSPTDELYAETLEALAEAEHDPGLYAQAAHLRELLR